MCVPPVCRARRYRDMINLFSFKKARISRRMDPTHFELEIDSGRGLCVLTKIESDLKIIFDCLSKNEDIKIFKANFFLRKCRWNGSTSFKGDYIFPLRNVHAFSLLSKKNELIEKIKEISYISDAYIDVHENLILRLVRSVLFRKVLCDAMIYAENYAQMKINQSYLVIVHTENLQDCNALRVALTANHLISFLTLNGAKVFVNDFIKYSDLSWKPPHTHVTCNDSCLENIRMTTEFIKKSAKECEWINHGVKINDCVVINAQKYVKMRSVSFGTDIGNIKIYENKLEELRESAYIYHLVNSHITECNSYSIIHISLQSQKHKILKSSLLIEMLGLIDSPQIFLSCQNVDVKDQSDVTVNSIIEYQKLEIQKAMSQKYSSCELKNKMWEDHSKILVDTAVKFSFLKNSMNDIVKIGMSCSQTFNKSDGVFIQYNFARLCNILKNFEIKVSQKYYKPLPLLDEIDFELLKLDEEWNLLSFISSFPQLEREIFTPFQEVQFHVNKICFMLHKLCHCFSLYYARIRILAGPQPKLQNVMYARLWLLKSVHQLMQNAFKLLNIQGLDQM